MSNRLREATPPVVRSSHQAQSRSAFVALIAALARGAPVARACAALVVATTLVAGCSANGAGPSGGPVSQLRIVERTLWQGFGPTQSSGDNARLLDSCLIDIGPKGVPVPLIAAAVPSQENHLISKDGLTIDYPLRRNVRWQDGAPLTAADVVFTFRSIMNPKNNFYSQYPYSEVRSMEAVTPYDLRVHMKRIFPPIVHQLFSSIFCNPILPRHLLSHADSLNETSFNREPIFFGTLFAGSMVLRRSFDFEGESALFRGSRKSTRSQTSTRPTAIRSSRK